MRQLPLLFLIDDAFWLDAAPPVDLPVLWWPDVPLLLEAPLAPQLEHRNARRRRGPANPSNASYLHNLAQQAYDCAVALVRPAHDDGYTFTVEPEGLAILLNGPLKRIMRRGDHDLTNPVVRDTAVAAFILSGIESTSWVNAVWHHDGHESLGPRDGSDAWLAKDISPVAHQLGLEAAAEDRFSTETAPLRRLLEDLRRRLLSAGHAVDRLVVWETAVAAFVLGGIGPEAYGAAVTVPH